MDNATNDFCQFAVKVAYYNLRLLLDDLWPISDELLQEMDDWLDDELPRT